MQKPTLTPKQTIIAIQCMIVAVHEYMEPFDNPRAARDSLHFNGWDYDLVESITDDEANYMLSVAHTLVALGVFCTDFKAK